VPTGPSKQTPLTIATVLTWADAHKARTGTWPRLTDSKTELSHGYTWRIIDVALHTDATAFLAVTPSLSSGPASVACVTPEGSHY
jgi:hypothetical protein